MYSRNLKYNYYKIVKITSQILIACSEYFPQL